MYRTKDGGSEFEYILWRHISTAQKLDLQCKQTKLFNSDARFDQLKYYIQYQLLVCYCFYIKSSSCAVQIRHSPMRIPFSLLLLSLHFTKLSRWGANQVQ